MIDILHYLKGKGIRIHVWGCHSAKDDWHGKLGARAGTQQFEFGESKGSSG